MQLYALRSNSLLTEADKFDRITENAVGESYAHEKNSAVFANVVLCM